MRKLIALAILLALTAPVFADDSYTIRAQQEEQRRQLEEIQRRQAEQQRQLEEQRRRIEAMRQQQRSTGTLGQSLGSGLGRVGP